ncbi:hypothetical protein [Paenibacillus nasutitermitis]|uniref:Uncharacterized protein n=1 Tax=Paenibacillus nasutitermitis TaxID=1652958 RepID=A0A916YP55_9BACL|nr:hypothetical protein [Paenibacillus nasutitermitis]GGD53912.1 hypothetical protein GCM10010911_09290 [Paenibacillus nasutitermitis]
MMKLAAEETWDPPHWALMERLLFDTLNQAAVEFVNRYVRPDGTLIWRPDWPGMDGSDDPYEGFMYLALLYVLGGSDETLELAHKVWEGITWQWTEYGQISREFDAYYDWMHHGEGYLYLYFMGLADPDYLKNRQRAKRFAALYTGDDPEAPNYDREKRLIRSPINGSKGPQFDLTEEDWSTHRGILDHYPAPFEDVPGVDYALGKCPWSDDAVYKEIIQMMNQRMTRGDVPLNLNATGMVTHAYLYAGQESYRDWVLEYTAAWQERIDANGGIIPDNVGLSGIIGEYMDGKWWGGYYGWRWPHGFLTIIEPLINAAANAVLMTGNMKQLDLARSQLDLIWELRKEEGGHPGLPLVPYKHTDGGWTDYRPANPMHPIHLWFISMADEDLERILRTGLDESSLEVHIPGLSGASKGSYQSTKHYNGNTIPWFQYMQGNNPNYPTRILEANYQLIHNQLRKMRSPEGDPEEWRSDGFNLEDLSSIHKWQEMCPVYFEGLLQMTLGAPMHVSHGGLQHASVRYFDALRQRPGLPADVAALVESVTASELTLQLVNLSLFERKELVVQAGAYGEHNFEEAVMYNQQGEVIQQVEVRDKWICVELAPGAGTRLKLTVARYVNRPAYESLWPDPHKGDILKGRTN